MRKHPSDIDCHGLRLKDGNLLLDCGQPAKQMLDMKLRLTFRAKMLAMTTLPGEGFHI